MRRAARLGLACMCLLANACSQEPDEGSAAQPATSSAILDASPIEPKLVVQFGHAAPVSAVTWISEGRNLVSIDEQGTILIWDLDDELILDRAQVFMGGKDSMFFHAMEERPESGSLSLVFSVSSTGETWNVCPAEALRDNRWCSLSLDLETRDIRPDLTIAIGEVGEAFPDSPDGQWWPETFRTVDRPELAAPDAAIVHVPEPGQFPGLDCVSVNRCDYGIVLYPQSPSVADEPIVLVGQERIYSNDADIREDGRGLVRVDLLSNQHSWVRTLDLETFSQVSISEIDQPFDTVRWLTDQSYILNSPGRIREIMKPFVRMEVPDSSVRPLNKLPARIEGADCIREGTCLQISAAQEGLEEYRAMSGSDSEFLAEPLNATGDLIGVGADGMFWRFTAADGQWQRMEQPEWDAQFIETYRLSPDGTQLAVITTQTNDVDGDGPLRLWLLDLDGNRLRSSRSHLFRTELPKHEMDDWRVELGDPQNVLRFTPDGRQIVFSQYSRVAVRDRSDAYYLFAVPVDDGEPARMLGEGHSLNFVMLDNERIFELESGRITRLEDGETLATVRNKPELLRAGIIADSGLIWGTGEDGRIQYWDASDGSLQLTTYLLPGNRFFSMSPGGRYDTNLGPDSQAIRWVLPDAPWESLAPQTFMRDFFEPGLYARLLDCRAQDNCDSAFRELAPRTLNRILPEVEIVDITHGVNQSEAVVTVEVREGTGSDGSTSSGIYNLRLFRNGRMVAMTPNRIEDLPTGARSWQDTVERWRRDNRLGDSGTYRASFRVRLPSNPYEAYHRFSAYAFNEDRIKSETAEEEFFADRNPALGRVPRAFVINIGIDGYEAGDLKLNYAVADAQLLARQLAQIRGYEVRQLSLLARRQAGGSGGNSVTKQTILRVLQLLNTGNNRETILAALLEDGIDASVLEEATPDDIVILSYSGHGWTDRIGNFFLIPSNGRAGGSGNALSSLLSSAELSYLLRTNQAGEIALVIDACFSSAIVGGQGFKPGPLGDAGLGQLAYDKGLRILAASQADNYAIEDERLNHGLLTFALAGEGEGLNLPGGADADEDDRIGLSEWLAYAETRLPSLSADLKIGRFDARRGQSEEVDPETADEDYIQRPTLFDFNGRPSNIVLRPN